MKDFIRKLLREDLGYSYVVGSAINDEYQLTEDDDESVKQKILNLIKTKDKENIKLGLMLAKGQKVKFKRGEIDLRGANLSGTDLRGVDLSGAILQDAKLFKADLSGADLRGIDLEGADLRYANLSDVILHNANLFGATLRDANLIGADMRGAKLKGAEFTQDLDLKDIKGLKK